MGRKPLYRISLKQLGQWHQRLGLVSAALVLLLAVTGLMLNHGSALGLDRRHVSAAPLLAWYGIEAPGTPRGFGVGPDFASQLGERLYYNDRDLGPYPGPLVGAAAAGELRVLATPSQLILLDRYGVLLEVLGAQHGLPSGIQAVGVSAGRAALRAADGIYLADAELTRWTRSRAVIVTWSEPAGLPDALSARIVQDYRGRGLSWERVLRDLHSGRLFGGFGVLVMDAAALMFVLLAGSGLWIYLRRR